MKDHCVKKGDVNGYYRLACQNGDKYACNAGRIAANDGSATGIEGLLTQMTNVRLSDSVISNLKNPTNQQILDSLTAVQRIKLGLMQGYGDYLSKNSCEENPIFPSRNAITELHYKVFEENGASPTVFGGSTVDKYRIVKYLMENIIKYNWCPNCSK